MAAANVGHGHVVPRPDGIKARCGGPPFCSVCDREWRALRRETLAHLVPQPTKPAPVATTDVRAAVYGWSDC